GRAAGPSPERRQAGDDGWPCTDARHRAGRISPRRSTCANATSPRCLLTPAPKLTNVINFGGFRGDTPWFGAKLITFVSWGASAGCSQRPEEKTPVQVAPNPLGELVIRHMSHQPRPANYLPAGILERLLAHLLGPQLVVRV